MQIALTRCALQMPTRCTVRRTNRYKCRRQSSASSTATRRERSFPHFAQLCLPQAVLPFLTIGLFYLVFFRLGVWHAFSLVSGALRSSAAQMRSALYEGCDHVLHRGSFAAGAARPHEVVRCARSLPMLSLMCVIRAAGKTATASQVLFNSLSVAGGARLSVAASRNLMLTCLLQVSPC